MFPKSRINLRQVFTSFTLHRKMGLYHRSVHFLFRKNLWLTNCLSSGGFMALGDLIQQEYQYRQKKIPARYDWHRIRRMFIVGAGLGTLHHHYYLYLDKLLPYYDFKTVLKKVAGDQFICAPPTIVLFYLGVGLQENKSLEQCKEEIKSKFKYTYMGDWIFWPPVQCVNFYYLPFQYRVVYINIATMVYDIFLSLMKHYDQKESESID